jgi:hypothetical protein
VLPSGLTVMPSTLPACVGAVGRLCAAKSQTTAVKSMLAVTANLRQQSQELTMIEPA